MDTLQHILLKKTHRDYYHSKEEIAHKPKRKKRSESLEAIFRLPKSVLDKLRPHIQNSPLKRERSHNQHMQETVELGKFGKEYHNNLRKTIIGQTKEMLNTSRSNKSALQHNNFISNDQPIRHGTKLSYHEDFSSQYDKNLQTLKILQKVIIKDHQLYDLDQNVLQLQANRLPIIRKRQPKRKKLIEAFEQKHPELSSPHKQPYRQKEYRLDRRNFLPYPSNYRLKEEKLDIRGWDIPEFPQG